MPMNDDQKETFQAAVRFAIKRIGSAKKLSDLVGCSSRQVFRWRDGESIISAEYARKVAEVAGLDVSDLRPDLFEE